MLTYSYNMGLLTNSARLVWIRGEIFGGGNTQAKVRNVARLNGKLWDQLRFILHKNSPCQCYYTELTKLTHRLYFYVTLIS